MVRQRSKVTRAAAAVRGDLEGFLVQALAARPSDRLTLVTVPAPVVPAERLWRADPGANAVLWHSPRRGARAGLGEAAVLFPTGSARFTTLAREAETLLGRTRRIVHGVGVGPRVSLLGGLAFAPGDAVTDGWEAFGDGRFWLPLWTYAQRGGNATLTLALAPGVQRSARGVIEAHRRIADALGREGRDGRADAVLSLREAPSRERWEAMVAEARAAILAGALQKVVLARRIEVTTSAPADPAALLGRLGRHEAGHYRFGVRIAGRTFLGATPELLVARRRRRVRSEALAGSLAVSPRDGGDPLLTDPKQRSEHAFVVRAIEQELRPLCRRLDFPETPLLRRLRHLVHLSTPFVGELAASTTLLELAERLHPTPAVGGVPPAEAAAWIDSAEGSPRGWFAGPVGCLEPGGDGELAVALRCALVDGTRVTVYAGAGIVAGSDPAAEYEETATKAKAALAALGLLA
jgi:isochorismate synthase